MLCSNTCTLLPCGRKGVWAENRQIECGSMSGMLLDGGYLERRGVFYKAAFELVPM